MEVMELYSYLIQGVIASAEMERDANIFLQNHWRTSCPDSIQVSHSQTATTSPHSWRSRVLLIKAN